MVNSTITWRAAYESAYRKSEQTSLQRRESEAIAAADNAVVLVKAWRHVLKNAAGYAIGICLYSTKKES